MFAIINKAFKLIPAMLKLTTYANKGNMKGVDWEIEHILDIAEAKGEEREFKKTYLTLRLAKATTNRRMRDALVMRYSEISS